MTQDCAAYYIQSRSYEYPLVRPCRSQTLRGSTGIFIPTGLICSPPWQAMGEYTFTDAESGDKVNIYYTFGYKRNDDGKLRIYLHYSSLPYSAAPRLRR